MRTKQVIINGFLAISLMVSGCTPIFGLDKGNNSGTTPKIVNSLVPETKGQRFMNGQVFSSFKTDETIPTKAPVKKGTFSVMSLDNQQTWQADTDEQGNFGFEEKLPDGKYKASVKAMVDGQEWKQNVGEFAIANGQPTTQLVFIIGTGSLKGVAKLEGTDDYSGINVQILNSNITPAKTDSKGRFTFYDLPQGFADGEEKEIQITKEGYEGVILKYENAIKAGRESILDTEAVLKSVQAGQPSSPPQTINVAVNVQNNPNIDVKPVQNVVINSTPTPVPTFTPVPTPTPTAIVTPTPYPTPILLTL